jgi:Flagellar hook-length control protein FliK
MSSSISKLSSALGNAQSVKAQSLSTLMAALTQVTAVSGVGANEADNPRASLQSAEAAIKATVIAVDPDGKAIVDIAGARIEAQLTRDLLSAGARNPDLLRPGARLLLPPDIQARVLTPATRVDVQGTAQGGSVGPAPVLASPYPPGSLGAAITRLAGIALPGAEAVVGTPQGLPLPAPTAPTLRPGMISHALQPEILTALVQASGRQVPLAQGLNSLLSLPPEATATLPDEVQAVLKALSALRSAPGDLAAPDTLQKAVANSGTFLEARLATLAQGGTLPPDFKALLLNLKSLLGAGPQSLPTTTGTALDSVSALLLGESLPTPDAAKLAQQAARTAPPTGRMAEAAPALADLQRATEGTLERVKLTQLASLPEHPEITFTDERAQPLRIALSLPLAPQGHDRPATAVMGMVIEHRPTVEKPQPFEREDEGSPATEGFPWKVRIALDLEETGPVQAEIALRGQSVGVTLWAERRNMAEAARAEIGALHKALTGAAFEVVNLEVKDGFPHLKAQPHAPVLDKRT